MPVMQHPLLFLFEGGDDADPNAAYMPQIAAAACTAVEVVLLFISACQLPGPSRSRRLHAVAYVFLVVCVCCASRRLAGGQKALDAPCIARCCNELCNMFNERSTRHHLRRSVLIIPLVVIITGQRRSWSGGEWSTRAASLSAATRTHPTPSHAKKTGQPLHRCGAVGAWFAELKRAATLV